MKIVDANVLLYAVDVSAEHHADAKGWLDGALSGTESIVLPWICLLAFLRIGTHPSIYPSPLRPAQALDVMAAWLERPNVVAADAGRRHLDALRAMIAATGTGGNLVNDAHLAALAVELEATIVTFDNDFARFPGVGWMRPRHPDRP